MKRMPGANCKVPEPFFTYFGGKHNLAGRYPLPKHAEVIEPFAGSAGYATVHWQSRVLLNDLDPVVCGVWEFLIRSSPTDVLKLPLVIEDLEAEAGICQEAKWLIGFWLKKGNSYPVSKPAPRMRSKLRPDSHWGLMIRHRIAKNVDKIKHWRVCCGSYLELPNSEATWFIDPPYERSGAAYVCNDVDYSQLAEWAASRRGQVICCGQPGDGWADFRPFANIKNVVNGRSIEMIAYRS